MSSLSQPAPLVRADFDDDFPVPRHLAPALHLLVELGYGPDDVDRAVEHLGRYSTAECCPWIDPIDRPAIEATLPVDVQWGSIQWDYLTYVPTN